MTEVAAGVLLWSLRFILLCLHPRACVRWVCFRARLSFGTSAGRTFLSGLLFKEMTSSRTGKQVELSFFADGRINRFVAKFGSPDFADTFKIALDRYKPA